MKKATVLLLLVFYLIPTIGMTVSAHFCGGKLTSVSMQLLGNEKCPCGSKKMKKDCCKTNTIKIIHEQQQAPHLSIDFSKLFSVHHAIIQTETNSFFFSIVEAEFYKHHSPALLLKQPLYLINSVFRI